MTTPDFGTKLESIKHIGDMIDGEMVCREDCPSVTHRGTQDTEWETAKKEITRVEIIDRSKGIEDGGGRIYINHEVKDAWIDYQDNGRTLKVFINESKV
jgi:hypothetical protein